MDEEYESMQFNINLVIIIITQTRWVALIIKVKLYILLLCQNKCQG